VSDFPLETDTDVQNLISRELEPWMADLTPFWDEGDELWGKWEVQSPPDDDPYMSKVQVGYGHYAVEVMTPRILGEKPSIAYVPLDDDRDDLAGVVMGRVVTYQLGTMRFAIAARDLIRQGLVTGYSAGKVGWIRRSHIVTDVAEHDEPADPSNPEAGTITVRVPNQKRVIHTNEPFFEVINNRDFVFPLTARSIKEAPAIWQRRWLTLGYLKERAKEGFYSTDAVNRITMSDIGEWKTAYGARFDQQGLNVSGGTAEPGDQDFGDDALIEVWERWEDDRLVTVASRRYLLRDEPNPLEHKCKPFVDFTPTPRPFQITGMGAMKLIDDIGDYLNTMMRQLADNLSYLANAMFKETEGADPHNKQVFGPGRRVKIPEMEDVEAFVMPQIDMGAVMNTRQALLDDAQRLTGAFDYPQQGLPGGSHTATGVSTIVQEGTKRIAEMIQVFHERTMVPLGWQLAELNAQYLDEPMLVDFTEDPKAIAAFQQLSDDAPIPPSGLARVHAKVLETEGRLKPMPEVGQDKALSDQAKQAAAAQLASALAPILASPANPLNMGALSEYMLKEYGVPTVWREKITTTPPPAATAQQAQALSPPSNGSGPSGPGGESLPTGLAQGAPGAPGPQGPPGMAIGQ
jgi:hypothetical protein